MSKNIDIVRSIDFDRLDMLVSERIGIIKLYAQNIDKAAESPDIHDAICRDLILPNVTLLLNFITAVNVSQEDIGR